MAKTVSEAVGLEQFIREAIGHLAELLSSRFVSLLIMSIVILYGILTMLSMVERFVSKFKPDYTISPIWRFVAVAILAANLHLRMIMGP